MKNVKNVKKSQHNATLRTFLISWLADGVNKLFKVCIRGYQKYISRFLPARCRYYPTCSQYGLQALSWHGVSKGTALTIRRVCSCHPLGGHGVDFVPLPLYQFRYDYINSDISAVQHNMVYVTHYHYSSHLNSWFNRWL